MLIVGGTRAVLFIVAGSPGIFAGLLFNIRRLFTAFNVSSTFSSKERTLYLKKSSTIEERENILNAEGVADDLIDP